jgi:hypothetical protein
VRRAHSFVALRGIGKRELSEPQIIRRQIKGRPQTQDVVALSVRRPVAGWPAQEPPVGVGVPGEGGDGSGRTVMKPTRSALRSPALSDGFATLL